MSTRAVTTDDHAAVREVVLAAFGEEEGPVVADLVDDLRREHARVELVTLEGEQVIGHVLLTRGWLDTRQALVEVLVLSPLSVAPEHQGRGVGTDLLGAALDAAREQGVPAVFLEGDPRFYGERGWETAALHGFDRPSTRIPEKAFQVVVLEAHEPWMTGALVYAEPFWSHDCVGLRDPLLAQLEQAFDYPPPHAGRTSRLAY